MSRLLIKYGGVGVIALAILWSASSAAIKAYRAANPPYQPPTIRYGILPRIVFPEKQFERKNFVQEFADDQLPSFSDQAKVYVFYRSSSSFMALDQDKIVARGLGFDGNPEEVTPGVYKFRNDNFNKTLTMNVLESSFKLEYPYANDQMLLNPGRNFSEKQAIDAAISFLRSGGESLLGDLDKGRNQATFMKIDMNSLREVSSISEANVIRVDFYRPDMDKMPILSTNFNSANVSVLVSGSDVAGKRIIGADYRYAPIQNEPLLATYPIKTASQAWEDLKSGNYWPAKDVKESNVKIRKMYLAYFEPITLTKFMQPIFVFEGDGDFVAYVPAITEDYLQKN